MVERYKKSLGQNFLVEEQVLANFVDSMELTAEDTILEIGSGDGRVTKEIAKKALQVISVEFDRDLIPILKNNLKDYTNVEIVNADILNYLEQFKKDKANYLNSDKFKIVGSIPYSITSPLIHKIISLNLNPKTLNFIMQLEVAEKIVSRPPKATYLSNLVQLFGTSGIVEKIPPTAFNPQPKVFSAILKISKTEDYRTQNINLKNFLGFLHKGFNHPRKMLNKAFDIQFLKRVEINPNLRPANLSLEEWLKLFQMLE